MAPLALLRNATSFRGPMTRVALERTLVAAGLDGRTTVPQDGELVPLERHG